MSKKTGIIAIIISIVSLCVSCVCVGVLVQDDAGQDGSESLQYEMYVGTKEVCQLKLTSDLRR